MFQKLDYISTRNTIILFTLLFIFSILLFFYAVYISGKNLAFDEFYSIAMIDYSYKEIYNITAGDVHPPLFYWVLKLVGTPLNLTYGTFYKYKYITALIYSFTLLLCFFPIRRLLGTSIAFFTAIIIIILPVSFYTYSYVRMYCLAVPLLLGTFIYICDTAKNNTLWSWIKLFIFALCAMYTHYYALISTFWMYLIYGLFLYSQFRRHKRYLNNLKLYLGIGFFLVICYIPWLIELYKQMTSVSQSYWITRPTFLEVLFSLQYYFSPKHFEERYDTIFSSSWMLIITIFTFIMVLLIVINGSILKKNKEEKIFGLYAFLSFYISLFFILGYSLIFTPVFFVRYLNCFIGLFAVGCSIFVSILLKNGGKWSKCIVGFFFLFLFFVSGTCYFLNEKRKIQRENNEIPNYSLNLKLFMENTNGIIYTEEILAPNLAVLSMIFPDYEYRIINDGVTPLEMTYVPDYDNDPYALAPFKLLKAVPAIEIDEYGVYATTFPETIERIIGKEYEVVDHLEGSILYKFRKRQNLQ